MHPHGHASRMTLTSLLHTDAYIETPGAICTRGITEEFKGREPKLITTALSKIGG